MLHQRRPLTQQKDALPYTSGRSLSTSRLQHVRGLHHRILASPCFGKSTGSARAYYRAPQLSSRGGNPKVEVGCEPGQNAWPQALVRTLSEFSPFR